MLRVDNMGDDTALVGGFEFGGGIHAGVGRELGVVGRAGVSPTSFPRVQDYSLQAMRNALQSPSRRTYTGLLRGSDIRCLKVLGVSYKNACIQLTGTTPS